MTTKQIEELRAAMIAVEDFINEPRRGRDDHPDVTDYRHEVYRVWSPLRDMISTTLTERSTPESEEEAREIWRTTEHKPTCRRMSTVRSLGAPYGDCTCDHQVRAMLRFAQQSAKPAEGWVCVPREAIDAMIEAGASAVEDYKYDEGHKPFQMLHDLWSAMLSASPDRGEG